MYNASLYAALLLGYTIHFIYCIWGNLSLCGNDLQGPKGGPAVVLLPHIAADAMAGRARYSGGRKGGADWQALAQTVAYRPVRGL